MQTPLLHVINNNSFWVTPDRGVYWEEENTLIVADVHLGKSGHFRKSGIGIPQSIYKMDLQRLIAQLYLFKAERLVIVGDFTHSSANKELDLFMKWRKDFSLLRIDLVKGNHDVLSDAWYRECDINVSHWKLAIGDFMFLHDLKEHRMLSDSEKTSYAFTGHLHPGIGLKGRAKQALYFPCFYFGSGYCVLPAFSHFTGTYLVKPQKGETVFAIVENSVVHVPSPSTIVKLSL